MARSCDSFSWRFPTDNGEQILFTICVHIVRLAFLSGGWSTVSGVKEPLLGYGMVRSECRVETWRYSVLSGGVCCIASGGLSVALASG